MRKITLDYPRNSADAIRSVCFLNGWTVRRLAEEMGLENGSHLSQILNHKAPGSDRTTERILAHMPEKYRKHMESKP